MHHETAPYDRVYVAGFYNNTPEYAILSHTWVEGDEINMQDLQKCEHSSKAGWAKIRQFCALLASRGYTWCWVDTCCIDKTSSAELQEAINSMYNYYKRSESCIAYLADVPPRKTCDLDEWARLFRDSRWFRRGWTLQELLAPRSLEFWPADWSASLGTKTSLLSPIMEVTRISKRALLGFDPDLHYAVDILHWASWRDCTRIEDQAYSSLGLLGINMPLLYGEGQKSFLRLQQEVLTTNDDESVLAWTTSVSGEATIESTSLFAPSVRCFARSTRTNQYVNDANNCRFCDRCGVGFQSIAWVKSHLCGLSNIQSASRPLALGSRGLHVQRVLYAHRSSSTYSTRRYVMLSVSRDSSTGDELLLEICGLKDASGEKTWPQKSALNYALCNRKFLLSRKTLGDALVPVPGGPFEVLILRRMEKRK